MELRLDAEIDDLLTSVVENAVVCELVELPEPSPDPGDDHLWSLLAARPEALLITGDRALVEDPPDWASVVTPRTWIDGFRGSAAGGYNPSGGPNADTDPRPS